jgi:hypothetical protein
MYMIIHVWVLYLNFKFYNMNNLLIIKVIRSLKQMSFKLYIFLITNKFKYL